MQQAHKKRKSPSGFFFFIPEIFFITESPRRQLELVQVPELLPDQELLPVPIRPAQGPQPTQALAIPDREPVLRVRNCSNRLKE